MNPGGTRGFRASMVSRARFIEDLVAEQAEAGTTQYVLLGAGLDTVAQRRPDLVDRLTIFEIDQPGTQAWKRDRLIELGYGIPSGLRLVPMAEDAGFGSVRHVSSKANADRYFSGRSDGLRPSTGEDLLVAIT